MAWVLEDHGKAVGMNGATVSGLDTGSADLLAILVSNANQASPTPTDSVGGGAGNTWVKAREQVQVQGRYSTVWTCENPGNKGASHAFTVATSTIAVSFQVFAFSGSKVSAASLDQVASAESFDSTTITPGPITPGEDDELVLTHISCGVSGIATIDSSFTSPAGALTGYGDADSGGTNLGGFSAYRILSGGSGVAVDPIWTTGAVYGASTILTFKMASAPGGGGPVPAIFNLYRQRHR